MREPEVRYPCPVCLGVKLEKLRPSQEPDLVLDYCRRCGGIWFDEGEVARLRGLKPRALWAKVTLRDAAYRMKCHNCHASMDRNAERCPSCGRANAIDCPVCTAPLQPIRQDGVRVEICRRCRGAWFDNVELADIWNRTVDAVARRRAAAAPRDVTADGFFLPDLVWWPVPIPAPGPAAVSPVDVTPPSVADAGGGFFDSVGDALGGAAESTGDLAGDVFGSIADIFDGLDFDF